MTGNPIRFIQQRGGMDNQNSRSSSVIPFYNRSKFGDRITDHVRILRKSWDRYLEEGGGANQSGSASKLLYGQSSLKSNNYIRFDKQTSRENYHRDPSSKAHPARFIYLPESDFTRSDKKVYNIAFAK